MLHVLVALVAVVVEHQVTPAELPAVPRAIRLDAGPDVLVNDAAEADQRVIAEEPHLPVRREAGTRMEQHVMADVSRLGKLAPQPVRRRRSHVLIGVDVEDPLAVRQTERAIAGRREVVPPREFVEARAVRGGDFSRAVGGARVDDHDLVHEPPERAETAVEELLFVLDDQAGRQRGKAPERRAFPRARVAHTARQVRIRPGNRAA